MYVHLSPSIKYRFTHSSVLCTIRKILVVFTFIECILWALLAEEFELGAGGIAGIVIGKKRCRSCFFGPTHTDVRW